MNRKSKKGRKKQLKAQPNNKSDMNAQPKTLNQIVEASQAKESHEKHFESTVNKQGKSQPLISSPRVLTRSKTCSQKTSSNERKVYNETLPEPIQAKTKEMKINLREKKEVFLGKPVQLVYKLPNENLLLDEAALSKILLQDEIRELSVIVVTVTRAFYKDKSSVLDQILSYFSHFADENEQEDKKEYWLDGNLSAIKSHSWGLMGQSWGIWAWSKAFTVQKQDGTKLAVILMDAHGIPNTPTKLYDVSSLLTLSTMLSSVQIYELCGQNIKEDLMGLRLLIAFSKLTLTKYNVMQLQDLYLLMSGWQIKEKDDDSDEISAKLVESKVKEMSENLKRQVLESLPDLESCFNSVSYKCAPSFEKGIINSPQCGGPLDDMESECNRRVRAFICQLLSTEELFPKKFLGKNLKAHELFECFKFLTKAWEKEQLPYPEYLLAKTTDVNTLLAAKQAQNHYIKIIKRYHSHCLIKAVEVFSERIKLYDDEALELLMKNELHEVLDHNFEKLNTKNLDGSLFLEQLNPEELGMFIEIYSRVDESSILMRVERAIKLSKCIKLSVERRLKNSLGNYFYETTLTEEILNTFSDWNDCLDDDQITEFPETYENITVGESVSLLFELLEPEKLEMLSETASELQIHFLKNQLIFFENNRHKRLNKKKKNKKTSKKTVNH